LDSGGEVMKGGMDMSEQELHDKIDKLLLGFGEFKINIDKKFSQVDKRFDEVDKRFDKLENDIRNIYKKLEEHDERFNRIDSKINTIKKMAAENYIDIADLKDRVFN
jgi:peptidoglycan hydrolase CwlO-like protein